MPPRGRKRSPFVRPGSKGRRGSSTFSTQLDEIIDLIRACELDEAFEIASALRERAVEAGEDEAAGRAASFLGEIAAIRGDITTSTAEFTEAIERLESTELAGTISRAYRGWAHCYLTFEMPRLAQRPAREASRIAEYVDARETRDRAQFECAICEGLIAIDLSQIDEAERELKSVEHHLDRMAEIDDWLPGLYNLLRGRILIERGRSDGDPELVQEGTSVLEHNVEHLRTAGLPYWEARALDALARTLEVDDIARAITTMQAALVIYRRIGAAELSDSTQQWLRSVSPSSRNRYSESDNRPARIRLSPDVRVVDGHFISGPRTRGLIETAVRFAQLDLPVLVTGASGTGKEGVARMIHAQGPRVRGPFVPVNCASLPSTLVESMIFGHKKGTFTGAVTNHSGFINDADGGTLFLDEIGELPIEMQPKLLRFLESGRTRMLGETAERAVDVRVICATNRDLSLLVERGEFRADLFYRINVLHFKTLSLVDRTEEIPRLAQYVADEHSAKLSISALNALSEYSWPGNVRQLRNVVQRAYNGSNMYDGLSDREAVREALRYEPKCPRPPRHVSQSAVEPGPRSAFPFMQADGTLRPGMKLQIAEREFQRYFIVNAIRKHNGNKTRAAEELGIKLQTMHIRATKLGLVESKKAGKAKKTAGKAKSKTGTASKKKDQAKAPGKSGGTSRKTTVKVAGKKKSGATSAAKASNRSRGVSSTKVGGNGSSSTKRAPGSRPKSKPRK